MFTRIYAIMRKEFLHIIRDRNTLILIFMIPIIQMMLLGYAANTDIKNIALAVWDQDQSDLSRKVITAFDQTDQFAVTRYITSDDQKLAMLDSGEVRGVISIPEDFEQLLADGEKAEIELTIDGSDPTVANLILAGALQIGQKLAQEQALAALQIRAQEFIPPVQSLPVAGAPCPAPGAGVTGSPPAGVTPFAPLTGQPAIGTPAASGTAGQPLLGATPSPAAETPVASTPTAVPPTPPSANIPCNPVVSGGAPPAGAASVSAFKPPATMRLNPDVLYNPDLVSVNYMIPALMGMILQFLATLVTSMAIVRERERGTIEQLIVTPITSVELVIGKVTPFVLVAFLNLLEVLLIAIFWFGVPIHGSIPLLLTLSALFLLGALGLGIMISTAARTQQEAMLLSFLILMPSIFLSGFFFPLDAMPFILRAISYLIPLRYMLIIIRSLVLKGVGFPVLQNEIYILIGFCILILAAAARRFRASVD